VPRVLAEPTHRTPRLSLIFSVTLIAIMGNSLIAPVVPDLLRDLDVGDGGAGFVIAAVALPGVAVAPLIGLMADRLGRRAVLVPCLMIFGVAGAGVAAAPSFQILLAGRFLQGIGAAGLINLAVVIIGDHWEGERRTQLIGRNAAMLTVGLASFPLLSGVIAEFTSWRLALLPQAFGLIVAVWAWRTLDPTRPPSAGTIREQLNGLGDVMRRPSIVAVLVSGLLVFMLIFGVFLSTLPLHLEREFGLGSGGRGAILSIPAVTASLVAFNLGRISSTIGRRTVLVGATAVFVVSFSIMGAVPLVWVMALACALYGLGDGAIIPILQDTAVTEAPPEHRGAVVAVWVGAARLGQTIGPLLAAATFTATSTSTALFAGAALAGVLLVIMLTGPLARRPRVQPTQHPT
jgi:MFS transporter, ACDE family, multidrug resistance protein